MSHSIIEIFLISCIAYAVELGVAWFIISTVKKTESRIS